MAMRLLARPHPNVIAHVGNMYVSMEQNQGAILRQSRYDNLPTQPVPLGPSGLNPNPIPLNRLDTDVTIQWYGKLKSAVVKPTLIDLEFLAA